jgi:hypothetical protein
MKKRTTKKTAVAKKTVAKKAVAKKPAARGAATGTRRPATSVATRPGGKPRQESGNGRARDTWRPPELPAVAGWPPFRYPPD